MKSLTKDAEIEKLKQELEHIKQKLHDKEMVFNNILESTLAGYWDWYIQKDYEYMSPTFKSMFGYKDHELPNSPDTWQKLIHPDDLPGVLEVFQKHIDTKGHFPYDNEVRYFHKDGSIVWVYCRGRVIEWDAKGNPLRMVGCHIDITERKQAEEKFKGILESAPDAMVIVGDQGNIMLVNSQLKRLFGYTHKELLGKKVEILIPGRFQQNHPAFRKSYLQQPHPRPMGAGLDLRAVRKDGSEFPVEVSLSPFRTNSGTMVLAAIRDITRRKEAELQLKKSNQQLHIINQDLEAFSYSVSHDLRAPLRAISGYSIILKEDYEDSLDKEGQKILNTILRNTKKMGKLIDDILSFSRLARHQVEMQAVNMHETFREAYQELTQHITDRSIEFKLGELENIHGDKNMIFQMVTNLLSNAIKYTQPVKETIIEVEGNLINEEYVYSVKDNGVGFDMQFKDKLFGVFQRLHKDKEFEGSGVGLAIVQKVLDHHHGRIWVESTLNKGTTFYFTIPTHK
ncbi:PAS domain S-box protein [Rapidithrix thailandica]|uniref:histidine kinase n=1 Tax=Rapidithrix thailandica TaxID=413964 RepID=A0AAW9S921_9BACT